MYLELKEVLKSVHMIRYTVFNTHDQISKIKNLFSVFNNNEIKINNLANNDIKLFEM